MRSRYTAHVRNSARYLIETTLQEQRDELGLAEVSAWLQATRWKGLRITHVEASSEADGDISHVSFEALYETGGKHYLHRERSRFLKRGGEWFFDLHAPVGMQDASSGESILLGRNDACPCQSGKKLKKCCASGASGGSNAMET